MTATGSPPCWTASSPPTWTSGSCGPLELTDTVQATLVERGVDPDHIHRELFHVDTRPARRPPPAASATAGPGSRSSWTGAAPASPCGPAPSRSWTPPCRLCGDTPYACKNGVCGNCRAKLVEGRVEMPQNFALEREEVERGYVLACQSYPASDQVTLDFDQ